MSQNHSYREQIDACRPGSDDLTLPALAGLAEAVDRDRGVADELARSQRFDRAVSAAMHDVPLPIGLLERLEARLAAGESLETTDDEAPARLTGEAVSRAILTESASPTAAAAPRRINRRGLWAAVASIAAIVLIIVASQLSRPPRQVANHELAVMASDWLNQKLPESAWQPISSEPPYSVPAGVRSAARWQKFSTSQGQKGIVIELRGSRPGGQRPARLFIIASRDKYSVPTIPYTRLTNTTGQVAVAAWHTANLLYVVVVEENGQKLSDFIQPKRITIALPPAALRPA